MCSAAAASERWPRPEDGTRCGLRHEIVSLGLGAPLVLSSCGSRSGLLEGASTGATVAEAGVPDAPLPEADAGSTVVLFGGQTSATSLNDTWSFDGTRWSLLTPTPSPPARIEASMATIGDAVVLFGGYGGGSAPRSDTWTFDGTSWTPVSAPLSPPGRADASMATLGSGVVLFGGWDASGSALGDTWTFDGSSWSEVTVPGPSARAYASMAAVGDRVVLFGGAGDNGAALGDTWTFDGAAWSEVLASPAPPARYEALAAPLGVRVVLFAGFSGSVARG